MKLIALTDTQRLREEGIPFTRSYLYKIRHYNLYPGLIPKVGGRLMLDVDEFHRMVQEDVKKQTAKKKKLDSIMND